MGKPKPIFLMTIFNAQPAAIRQYTVLKGIMQFGSIEVGAQVSLLALDGSTQTAEVVSVVSSDDPLKRATPYVTYTIADKHLQLTVAGLSDPADYDTGFVLSPPDSMPLHSAFVGRMRFFTREEGGVRPPIGQFPEAVLNIHDLTFLVATYEIEREDSNSYAPYAPGEQVDFKVLIARYVPLEKGMIFRLQQSRVGVYGEGAVLELL